MAAPQVHILATSREALQVEGEHVYKLDPLACPPDDPRAHRGGRSERSPRPAVRRARGGERRSPGLHRRGSRNRGEHLPKARRGGARDRVGRSTGRGIRPATNRRASRPAPDPAVAGTAHRAATSKRPCRPRSTGVTGSCPNWSASCFAGSPCSSDILRSTRRWPSSTSATVDQALVFGAIDSLVAKSMVATSPLGAMMRYRLLDTTRAYALETSIDDGRVRRPGRAPRYLLPAMAGADRDRLADLVDRRRTGAALCRPQQCPGGFGMVLRRQRQCQDRRRTRRRRRAGFLGDVSADRMSSLVGTGASRSRRSRRAASSRRCIFRQPWECR